MTEPAGSGIEQSDDWDLGEDLAKNCSTDCYFFSGTRDDGPDGHGFGRWSGQNGFNLWLHKDDPGGSIVTHPHDRGNMLNVVFRLLADGGQNTACSRLLLSGCGFNVTALGITRANRIMFDTIQWYLPSSAQWEELAMYATLATFDRYARCNSGFDASGFQDSVDKAFGAIGYPRPTPPETCP